MGQHEGKALQIGAVASHLLVGGGQGGAVPFVVGGRGGGGGGTLVEPGTYVVRLTIGDKTYTTSVQVLEDIWMQTEK